MREALRKQSTDWSLGSHMYQMLSLALFPSRFGGGYMPMVCVFSALSRRDRMMGCRFCSRAAGGGEVEEKLSACVSPHSQLQSGD